jgi:hypothetical protein
VLDSTRTPLTGVVYDYPAGSYGLLLTTFPLADGYHVRLLSIDAQSDSVKTVGVKVTGRDRASTGHGRLVDVWKVVDGSVCGGIAFSEADLDAFGAIGRWFLASHRRSRRTRGPSVTQSGTDRRSQAPFPFDFDIFGHRDLTPTP